MKSYEYLRTVPFFWSRLGFCYDPPRYGDDRKLIVFSKNYEKYRKFHKNFEDAGVRYHTSILHSGWVDDGVYDYSLTDETLEAMLAGNPDILYMPRVKLNAPPGWCKNHPEDVFLYEKSKGLSVSEISEKCGTTEQDYFGFDCPSGYPVNGGDGSFKDDRPNIGGDICLQSFSSTAWVNDASIALEKLIRHIEDGPYAAQIIGYHIAFGQCGETALWGSWRRRNEWKRGDFGYTNTQEFIRFGLSKYKTEEALLKKWDVAGIEEIGVPSLSLREGKKEKLRNLFFDESYQLICHDYLAFSSEVNARACEAFCKTVKDTTGGRCAAGVFYGYTYTPLAGYMGHCDMEKILQSQYIDFLAAPKGYYRCLAGDPGGEQGASYSFSKKKVWLEEIDNRTHLDMRGGGARNFLETRTVLLRDGVKNLAANQGFWWMDLGDGWYDMPGIMECIKELHKAQATIASRRHKSIAEVLIVTDDNCGKYMSLSYGLYGGLLYNLLSETRLIGAPVDILRLADLYDTELSQYKLIIFANTFCIDDHLRNILRENAKGKTYIWHYAAGILKPDFALDNVTELTGFRIAEFEHTYADEEVGYQMRRYNYAKFAPLELDFPLVEILPEKDVEVISRYPNGKILCAKVQKDGGTSILCALASLLTEDIRQMAVLAGCRMYAPAHCTVYADNRIIGVFPKNNVDFVLDLGESTVTGRHTLPLKIPAGGAEYFIID